jgi:hypothetical protein
MRTLLRPRSRMLLEGDEGGLGGHYPLGHLRRGGGSISALRVTGDPAKGDPGGEAPRPRPPPPSFTGVIFSVTGKSCSSAIDGLSMGSMPSAMIRSLTSCIAWVIQVPPVVNRPVAATRGASQSASRNNVSRSKALLTEIQAAIARGLGAEYNTEQPIPARLADLLRQFEQQAGQA